MKSQRSKNTIAWTFVLHSHRRFSSPCPRDPKPSLTNTIKRVSSRPDSSVGYCPVVGCASLPLRTGVAESMGCLFGPTANCGCLTESTASQNLRVASFVIYCFYFYFCFFFFSCRPRPSRLAVNSGAGSFLARCAKMVD